MVDQASWIPKEALGMDLPVGHIHAHQYARRDAPSIEQADSKCYCLLDSGANALALLTVDAMQGTDAQCTVPGGGIVPGLVVQVLRLRTEDHHAVVIEGAARFVPLA